MPASTGMATGSRSSSMTKKPTLGNNNNDPNRRDHHSADFLKRLSIADAKVLLERSRKEKEQKTKEMQQMIGVRYRDLIESADKIVNMHSAAIRLEASLKEMPEKWKRLDANLKLTLAVQNQKSHHLPVSSTSLPDASSTVKHDTRSLATLNDCVFFLLKVPEEIWQYLDQGECLNAFQVYLESKKIYDQQDQKELSQLYPFVRNQWDCLSNFRWRIPEYARKFLLVRGRSSHFYADKLCTILLMETSPTKSMINIEQLFAMFLDTRSQWIWNELTVKEEEEEEDDVETKERQLLLIQKSILFTIRHVQDLFFYTSTSTNKSLLFLLSQTNKDTRLSSLEKDLEMFTCSGKCIQMSMEWLQKQQEKIDVYAGKIITSIPTIAQLGKIQAKLSHAGRKNRLKDVAVWEEIIQLRKKILHHHHPPPPPPPPSSSSSSSASTAASLRHVTSTSSVLSSTSTSSSHTTSLFTVLYGESFRQKTRDLVQNSFVDALEYVKKEIKSCVTQSTVQTTGSDNSGNSSGTGMNGKDHKGFNIRLKCMDFYLPFEKIHEKTGDLDRTSDLLHVLMEEFVRTMLKVLVYFEQEFSLTDCAYEIYTLTGKNRRKSSSASMKKTMKEAMFYLAVSNICACIATDLPVHEQMLFPSGKVSKHKQQDTIEPKWTWTQLRKVFETYANEDGHLMTEAFPLAWKDLCSTDDDDEEEEEEEEGKDQAFLEEEMKKIPWLSFHAFCLVAQMKSTRSKSQYGTIFSKVIQDLASKYADQWARISLRHKIQPLREFLHTEPYDLSNKEWRQTHETWAEFVITDDDDDEDLVEEKTWLPWCENPSVSNFLFSCCYALDEAKRLVRDAQEVKEHHILHMQVVLRETLVEQLTLVSVETYEEAVDLLLYAKKNQVSRRIGLNFGESCIQQCLFDMYFVRATLGFSDFIRFGWGDEINEEDDKTSRALIRLKKLFEKMHAEFMDPVDWEIYGPQLIENVVIQFRKSRLLFSSLSDTNDINEINGKKIHMQALQETRPILQIAEPVPRFSLLPVPTSSKRRTQRSSSAYSIDDRLTSRSGSIGGSSGNISSSNGASVSGSVGTSTGTGGRASLGSLKLHQVFSSSAGSNILSAAASAASSAASGTNLLSSAAKGMSFLSSATSSYLREDNNTQRPNGYSHNSSTSR